MSKQITYRGITATYSVVYNAYCYTLNGERFRATGMGHFKWDLDGWFARQG